MDALEKVLDRITRARAMAGNVPEPQYNCNICQDTEWVFAKDENGVEFARPCECRERKP